MKSYQFARSIFVYKASSISRIPRFYFAKHEKKDKYWNQYSEKRDKNIEFEGEDDSHFNEEILSLFESDNEITEESIISKIKNKIALSSSFTPMEMARINQNSAIDANLATFMSEGGTDNFYEKSEKLTQAMRLKKDMSLVSKTKAMEKYGNYSDYTDINFERKEKSYSRFKDEETIESRSYSQDFKTGSLMRNIRDYDMSNDHLTDATMQYYVQDNEYLSYNARRELYKLHLEGWTIRKLSVRYGIIPERTKAIIWCENYFKTEIEPYLKPEEVYRINRNLDRMDEMSSSAVDYGVDIAKLAERERFVPNLNFDVKDVEKHRDVINKDELLKMQRCSRMKKHEWVFEDFLGEGTKGFYLKNWVKFRGFGRESVSRTFRSVLYFSHKTHLLKDKVRLRLDKGPRMATLNYRK